jgi:hypothetical protein
MECMLVDIGGLHQKKKDASWIGVLRSHSLYGKDNILFQNNLAKIP